VKLEGNRTIRWTSVGAKQTRRTSPVAVYEVTLSDGKQHTSLTLDATDGETEVDLFGLTAVFAAAQRSLVVTVAGRLPPPLDDTQLVALIEQRSAKAKLAMGDMSIQEADGFWNATATTQDGTPLWHARVGMYSRRVWFEKPAPRIRNPSGCMDNPLAKGCI
jgi:hypothetical protein